MAKHTKKMVVADPVVVPALENPETVSQMKAAYVAHHSTPTTLTDAQIDKLVDDYDSLANGEADEDSITPSKFVAAMRIEEGHDAPAELQDVSVTAQERDATAIAFGKKLGGTRAFASIQIIVSHKEELKWLPGEVALFLSREVPKEERLAMPKPGSEKKDVEKSNRPYDLRGPGKGSWFGDAIDETPFGIGIATEKRQLNLAIKRDKSAPPEFLSKGGKWCERRIKALDARRSNAVRSLRDAVNLLAAFDTVVDTLRLEPEFRTEGDDKHLVHEPDCIEVFCKVKRGRSLYISPAAFLQVKLEEVAKTEDHFANFVVERAARRDKNKQAVPPIKTIDQFAVAAYFMSAWGESDATVGECLARIHSEDEGPEFADAVVKLHRFLGQIAKHPDTQKQFRVYQEREKMTDKTAEQAAA